MTKHPTCQCPNEPNYYWRNALDCFHLGTKHHHEMYMWLLLYAMATEGEEE